VAQKPNHPKAGLAQRYAEVHSAAKPQPNFQADGTPWVS
jgi:hypothetical protein